MTDKPLKRYLFASDFDQTLTFNDSGYVLSELVGIPTAEFERKSKGMAELNLVQQGAELAYLLLHDPEFRARVRREHLYEVGKRIRLKDNIELLHELLDKGIEGHHFEFYVLSAAPLLGTEPIAGLGVWKGTSGPRNLRMCPSCEPHLCQQSTLRRLMSVSPAASSTRCPRR